MRSKLLDLNFAERALQLGELVVYPTETFMALGCIISNVQAIEKVFALKQRSKKLALPLIIGNTAQLEHIAADFSPALQVFLMKLELFFWPGPLTILLPAHNRVHPLISAGTDEVAVRLSSHPQARELALRLGPLVASSANVSGQPPVVNPHDLGLDFLKLTAGYLEPKPRPSGGLASTIVRPSADGTVLQVLRQGAISVQRLSAAGFEIVE